MFLLVACALTACGKTPSNEAAPNVAASQSEPAPPQPAAQAPAAALTRKDLLDAAAAAASDYAEGRNSTTGQSLVGRTFAVRIAFGCKGPGATGSADAGIGQWSWGDDRRTIRISMQPADWKESAMIAQAKADKTWEAVEGFWIPHPWVTSEECPTVSGDPLQTSATASPQTLGLAAVFDAGGSRISRREGRAYEFTVRAEGEAPLPAPANGYRLLLEGRVEPFPSGRAIECRSSAPDERPVCVVASRLDHVAFEKPDGTRLADWRTD